MAGQQNVLQHRAKGWRASTEGCRSGRPMTMRFTCQSKSACQDFDTFSEWLKLVFMSCLAYFWNIFSGVNCFHIFICRSIKSFFYYKKMYNMFCINIDLFFQSTEKERSNESLFKEWKPTQQKVTHAFKPRSGLLGILFSG